MKARLPRKLKKKLNKITPLIIVKKVSKEQMEKFRKEWKKIINTRHVMVLPEFGTLINISLKLQEEETKKSKQNV